MLHGVILVLGDFSWGWDSLVAIGTLALAAGTVWLAWSTRMMASASRTDERAQWRPALVPGVEAPVKYDEATGEMSFEIRNAGRGPAFGISARLRTGKRPLGASVPSGPGTAVALAPAEAFSLRCRVTDPSQQLRGWVIEAEISYYDITERWHQSIFTIAGHKPHDKLSDPSVLAELRIAKAFVYETDREVLPVLGSRKAMQRETPERGLWRRAKRRIRDKA